MPTILVVDDEEKLRRVLEVNLQIAGFSVVTAPDAAAALNRLRLAPVDLLLTDLRMPGKDGLALLEDAKRLQPDLIVVMMTAFAEVGTAIEAMKRGASDYLTKPISNEELVLVLRKELDVGKLREENRNLREALGERYSWPNIVARSPQMQQVLGLVERVAPTNSTVLLGGESGVGKDLIARAIHQHSRRAAGPFIKINSTAIPENLLESELFGFEKGAFTGAVAAKPGKFEMADGGSLFLDEIGDVPPATQVKLLRVLQEREFERLGGTKTLKVDLRLIAATNRNLRAALEQGTFRQDLYYRLNVVPIDIPPLRERREDIVPLAEFFLARFVKESGKQIRGFSRAGLDRLMEFHWPGNARELENVVERGVALGDGPELDVADIRLDPGPARTAAPGGALLPDGWTLDGWEEEVIKDALKRANGNKSQAARLLGLSRNALRYRLSTMGVEDKDAAEGA